MAMETMKKDRAEFAKQLRRLVDGDKTATARATNNRKE